MLDKLPELSTRFKKTFKHCKLSSSCSANNEDGSDTLSEAEEEHLSETLSEAKDFCIKEIIECLGDDPDVTGTHLSSSNCSPPVLQPTVKQWLTSLSPPLVISIYNSFSDSIQERNGWVVPTNHTLHNCTGSSCNALLLGNTQQSCASLFYVMPYLCKNKVALQACLVALEKAQQHVQKYPSISEQDTGTDKRTVQHMFTRVVNELSRSIQISDTQAALALLNMGTKITSDSFNYFGADFSVNHFVHNFFLDRNSSQAEDMNSKSENSAFSQSDSDSCPKDDDSFIGDHNSTCGSDSSSITEDDIQAISDFASTPHPLIPNENKTFGPAPFYRVPVNRSNAATSHDDNSHSDNGDENTCSIPVTDSTAATSPDDGSHSDDCDITCSIPVTYPTHWWFRGEELKNLTMMEYAAIVDIVPHNPAGKL